MWFPGKPLDSAAWGVRFGKSAGSPPPVPDPNVVSSAQTSSNIATAQNQAQLNEFNQVSPFGSETFSGTIGQPDRTLTVALSPQEQQIFDQQMQLAQQLTGSAQNLGQQVSDISKTPFSLNGVTPLPTSGDLQGNLKQVQDALFTQQKQYLDPQFAQAQHDLDNSLANQGIPQGSEAWERAQNDLARQKQAAYSNAMDTAISGGQQAQGQEFGIGQATQQQEINNALLARTEPMNELAAALQGSPALQNPNFGPPSQTGIAPTDVTGAFNLSQQAQQQNFATKAGEAASGNSLTGAGIGALATAAAAAAMFF